MNIEGVSDWRIASWEERKVKRTLLPWLEENFLQDGLPQCYNSARGIISYHHHIHILCNLISSVTDYSLYKVKVARRFLPRMLFYN